MSKELFQLLQKGYFPKELPPSFNTYTFALTSNDLKSHLKAEWDDVFAAPIKCSIPKNGIGRRYVHVLHPLPFFYLSKYMVDSYSEIKSVCKQSTISYSTPVNNQSLKQRYYVSRSESVAEFQKSRQKKSLDKSIELKADISYFYPSIYTHTIPWAFVGRDVGKEIWNKRQKGIKCDISPNIIDKYDIGAHLDRLIEKCQEKQTHGIPVGPDTSFVVSEAILSHLDSEIQKKCANLTGCRYYDDYFLYFDTKEDAERTLKILIDELNAFGLELNMSKVKISEFPISIIEQYAVRLSQFNFNSENKGQCYQLYFDILWLLIRESPNQIETILKYGLKALGNNLPILNDSDEKTLHMLLLKAVMLSPSVTPVVFDVLNKTRNKPDSDLLRRITDAVFRKHLQLGHHLELLWALWICKHYELIISVKTIVDLFKLNNSLCSIMVLDYLHNVKPELLNACSIDYEINRICLSINGEALYDERWLLLYESVVKKWLPLEQYVDEDSFFSYLKNRSVSFYDDNINANYSDASYILSRSTTLPKHIDTETKKETDRILSKIKNKTIKRKREESFPFEELFDYEDDDNNDVLLSIDDEIADEVDEAIKDRNIYKRLFAELLKPIVAGESYDENKIVDEFVKVLMKMKKY